MSNIKFIDFPLTNIATSLDVIPIIKNDAENTNKIIKVSDLNSYTLSSINYVLTSFTSVGELKSRSLPTYIEESVSILTGDTEVIRSANLSVGELALNTELNTVVVGTSSGYIDIMNDIAFPDNTHSYLDIRQYATSPTIDYSPPQGLFNKTIQLFTTSPTTPRYDANVYANPVVVGVRTSTGYCRMLSCDATWGPVCGNGLTNNTFGVGLHSAYSLPAAYAIYSPKSYTLAPCSKSGALAGSITTLQVAVGSWKLTGLDLTHGDRITTIDVQYSGLTTINVPKTNALETLYMDGSGIKNVNYTDFYNIKTLRLGDCYINSFKTVNMVNLQTFLISSLRGTDYMDFRFNKDLTTIGIDSSDITSINVSGLSGMQAIYMSNGVLTSIEGLSTLSNLAYMYIENNNAVSSLNVAGLRNLTELSLSRCNNLTTLTNLSTFQDGVINAIQLEYTNLNSSTLNNIFTQLPTVTNSAYIGYIGCSGQLTCTPSIYLNKGWITD